MLLTMSRDWWVNPGGSEHLCMGIGGYHRGADFMMTAAGKIGEKHGLPPRGQ